MKVSNAPRDGLFPSFVARHTIAWDPADPRPPSERFPGILIPDALSAAVPRRQSEFAAGRYCAREALRRCAPERADELIGRGMSGEPLWPADVVGAITHSPGYASAAVARARDAGGIGLDAEPWFSADLAAQVRNRLATREELDALADATRLAAPRALTLLFSAKESLYKCLFPKVRRYFDFREVTVACADTKRGVLALKLLTNLTPSTQAGRVFNARFSLGEQRVCTGIVLRAS